MKSESLQHPYPLRGCNSDLARYSSTPTLRAAGFEDEDDDEDENEAPSELASFTIPGDTPTIQNPTRHSSKSSLGISPKNREGRCTRCSALPFGQMEG